MKCQQKSETNILCKNLSKLEMSFGYNFVNSPVPIDMCLFSYETPEFYATT